MWDESAVAGPLTIFRSVGGAIGSAPLGGGPIGGSSSEVVSGYHLNLRSERMAAAAAPYRIYPQTPSYHFLGDASPWTQTAFLRFESEWQARAILGDLWLDPLAGWGAKRGPTELGGQTELEFRAEVLRRLDDLQAALAKVSEAPEPGMGHNRPPIDPNDEVAQAEVAIAELARQLHSAAPEIAPVTAAARRIDRLGMLIELVRREPEKWAHVGLDLLRKAAIEKGGELVLQHWQEVQQQIGRVLLAIVQWLSHLW